MAMTALLASLLAMANPCAMRFCHIFLMHLLYVSPPTCVTYDLSERHLIIYNIGELHELTILANVTPVCQS